MDFGITIKPDILHRSNYLSLNPPGRKLRLFPSAGFFDFPRDLEGNLFRSSRSWPPTRKKMRLGTCVTNPRCPRRHRFGQPVRHPQPGLWRPAMGTGHRPPATAPRRVPRAKKTHPRSKNLEEFVRIFRNLNAGKTVDLEGVPHEISLDQRRSSPRLGCRLRPESAAHRRSHRRRASSSSFADPRP